MKVIDLMLSSPEYLFQISEKSEFEKWLVKGKRLFGNEKIIQIFFRNYFQYRLYTTPEKGILIFLNNVARSDLYNQSTEVQIGLNLAISSVEPEKFMNPCAEAIITASEDEYKFMAIVDLIEMAFDLCDNKEQINKFRQGVNHKIDIYTTYFPDCHKEIINKFKMCIPENQQEKINASLGAMG